MDYKSAHPLPYDRPNTSAKIRTLSDLAAHASAGAILSMATPVVYGLQAISMLRLPRRVRI